MPHTEEHRAAASAKLSTIGQRFFELIEFDEDEELVMEIRKHWFGQFVIELTGTLISIMIAVASFALAANLDSLGFGGVEQEQNLRTFLVGMGMILAVIGIIMTFISVILYRSNVIFVTSEKIAQVIYTNIISRKISQLSIGDVQDVTVHQSSIFARIFNYGTLVIETAGEQQNYTFTYVPLPYDSAKKIVGSHETNLRKFGN